MLAALDRITERPIAALEYRFQRSDGAWCWIRDEPQLVRGPDGEALEIVGWWHDITLQREYQEKLQSSEAEARMERELAERVREAEELLHAELAAERERHQEELQEARERERYEAEQAALSEARERLSQRREELSALFNAFHTLSSHRMNEIMKVLTLISTIMLPLTFLAGVYGMNFKHMPELEYKYAYEVCWAVMISIGVGMTVYFKKRGWL